MTTDPTQPRDERGDLTTLILGRTAPNAADAIVAAGWVSPAVVAERDAEIERLRKYAPSPEMEALLGRSSLGTDDVEAARESVSPDASRAVVRMAELMRERDEAERRLGAVAALADRKEGALRAILVDPARATLTTTEVRAVLGPVSGAVERAGEAGLLASLRFSARHPHKGPNDTDQSMLLAAASRLDGGHDCGGSHTRQTVARVLRAVVSALATPVAGHEQRLTRARQWIETCVDPVVVGVERKAAMLAYLDGDDDVPEDLADVPVAKPDERGDWRWSDGRRMTPDEVAGREQEVRELRAERDDERAGRKVAGEAADRFRDVVLEVLDLGENPGDDTLITELRQRNGKTGDEPRRWRDFLTSAIAKVDQIRADCDARASGSSAPVQGGAE
jgi:hypothetical protein